MKRNKLSILCFLMLFLLIIYIIKVQNEIKSHLSMDFEHFDNATGSRSLIVPNLIHYVHFDKKTLNFVSLICMLSAFYNHRPTKISTGQAFLNIFKLLDRYLLAKEGVYSPSRPPCLPSCLEKRIIIWACGHT